SAFAPERAADFSFAAGDARAALAAVRAGTGVLVSRNFARQFEVGVGTTLRLDTPAGPFEAPVAGVVVDYVSPRGSVILARPTYQRWWGDRSVNRFHVTLAPGASLDAVRHAIGVVLALIWVRVSFTYQLGWEIDFHFAAGSIPAAAAAALLVSVPAGLLPARRVARLPVLEALRAE